MDRHINTETHTQMDRHKYKDKHTDGQTHSPQYNLAYTVYISDEHSSYKSYIEYFVSANPLRLAIIRIVSDNQ